MIVLITLIIIILLYIIPLNNILLKLISGLVNNIVNIPTIDGFVTIIERIPLFRAIELWLIWIIYFVIFTIIPYLISKLIKVICKLINSNFYEEADNKIKLYLYKYSIGTKRVNYALRIFVGAILTILFILRIRDVRTFLLGFFIMTYVLKEYKKPQSNIKEIQDEDKRYKNVSVNIGKNNKYKYKKLEWQYLIDKSLVEKPITFEAEFKIGYKNSDDSYTIIQEGINELANQINLACEIKEFSIKHKISVVLSLLCKFKYNTNKETIMSEAEVIDKEEGTGVELGKCAAKILRDIGLDVDEVDLPRVDGERIIAIAVEGADFELEENYYIKNEKKYYTCMILKDGEYYIGTQINNYLK